MTEPRAEKRPHEITTHGHTRIDEYYWLRDDTRSDPEMLAYIEAENAWTDHVLSHTKNLQADLYKEMTSRLDPDDSSVPYEDDGYWYYERYEAGKEYPVHCRRKGSLDAPEEVFFDENARAEGHDFYDLGAMEVSDDHRYVAVAEDTLSREIYEIRILDTQTGEYLEDVIGSADTELAWSADGDYLFYVERDPKTLLGFRLMRHKIGTDSAEDVLVYEEEDNAYYTWVYRSRSGEFLIIEHQETITSEFKVLPASDPLGEPQMFLAREAGHEYEIDHANGQFFIRTNWNALNFRVMTTELATSTNKSTWKELIAHREDAMVEAIKAFDDWLVVSERQDGLRKIRFLNHEGTVDRYLDTEEVVYVTWIDENPNTNTNRIRYGYESMTTPEQIWEIDLASFESRLLKQKDVPGYDNTGYVTDRFRAKARDGTDVLVSTVRHKDTPFDGSAPVLINAYGAYGDSYDPYFANSVVSILDRGFVYALAHVRGGQEFGRGWYEQGRTMNKKNTFTDLIDVTVYLQEENLVDRDRTYATGGSAGGLLIGAVLNMAPELYHGMIAEVPFVDAVTTMLDETIPLTSNEWNEWGDPREKEAYDYMVSYSPYDQVSALDYPHLMVTSGLHDSRVQYFEPTKWVARLRDRRANDNVLVLRTNMDAGHSGDSGRYKVYEEIAEQFAFLIDLSGSSN